MLSALETLLALLDHDLYISTTSSTYLGQLLKLSALVLVLVLRQLAEGF